MRVLWRISSRSYQCFPYDLRVIGAQNAFYELLTLRHHAKIATRQSLYAFHISLLDLTYCFAFV